MPVVYSYFHPVVGLDPGTESGLIRLWQSSWKASEFLPILLSHQHADAHPRAAEFKKVVSAFPSINPTGYDLSCWMRWLALARVGGGLMTDYDVVARGFSPEFLALPDEVTVLASGSVPCAVYATPAGAEQIVDDIISGAHKHDGKHYSDMLWYQTHGYAQRALVAPFGGKDWQTAPAVHFSHFDCRRERPGKKRNDIISIIMGY